MRRPKFTAGYEATFGLVEKILEMMEKRGVTRADLARKIGVKPPAATKWFSPGRNLTIFTAAMIAEALDAELRFEVVDRSALKLAGKLEKGTSRWREAVNVVHSAYAVPSSETPCADDEARSTPAASDFAASLYREAECRQDFAA